jgi:hypothetical protein
MANPTTNYGFVLPTATDLVTDLPADFEVALQGVDTRLKALQPGTTAGDLAYSSATANTNTRLAIGTAGQVLKVNSGATAPEWGSATPAATSYTLINAGGTALTGAGTVTVNSIGGYNDYFIYVDSASGSNADTTFRLRFNADTGNNYGVAGTYTVSTPAIDSIGGFDSSFDIGRHTSNAGRTLAVCFFELNAGNSTGLKPISFSSVADLGARTIQAKGHYKGTSVISSVSIIASSGNLDGGTVYVYGAN